MTRLDRDAKNVVKFFAAVRVQVAVQCTWLNGTEIDDVALKLATAEITRYGAHGYAATSEDFDPLNL